MWEEQQGQRQEDVEKQTFWKLEAAPGAGAQEHVSEQGDKAGVADRVLLQRKKDLLPS